jgi:LysR family glycine cleavage system transcriptional activator
MLLKIMSNRLPPLNSIRVFEVAARHLSFTKAAKELRVTQAAVSRQIKLLEDSVGVAMFERRNNQLLLTEAGQVVLPGIRDGFVRLRAAFDRVSSTADESILRVTTTPGFATQWLVPRLHQFSLAHPEFQVRIDASTQVLDLVRENVDLCIRFGDGNYPDLDSESFLKVEIFPVCSPALLSGSPPLKEPSDLKRHALIHTSGPVLDDDRSSWREWLNAAGVRDIDLTRGPQFTEIGVAIHAAIEGNGVLLGRSPLISRELSAGRLVKPFKVKIKSNRSYYLAYPPNALSRPRVRAFRDWLLSVV